MKLHYGLRIVQTTASMYWKLTMVSKLWKLLPALSETSPWSQSRANYWPFLVKPRHGVRVVLLISSIKQNLDMVSLSCKLPQVFSETSPWSLSRATTASTLYLEKSDYRLRVVKSTSKLLPVLSETLPWSLEIPNYWQYLTKSLHGLRVMKTPAIIKLNRAMVSESTKLLSV